MKKDTKLSIKEKTLDTFGNVSYPLVLGSILDYSTGLSCSGIIAARTYATGLNAATGAPYGMWRNLSYRLTRTTDESNWLRKYFTDLFAFNTFQVPAYATVVAVGSLVSEGRVDWEKVKDGAEHLALISPLIGPTMGWYIWIS